MIYKKQWIEEFHRNVSESIRITLIFYFLLLVLHHVLQVLQIRIQNIINVSSSLYESSCHPRLNSNLIGRTTEKYYNTSAQLKYKKLIPLRWNVIMEFQKSQCDKNM